MLVSTRTGSKKGTIEIYPKFIIKKSSDLMIRGSDFYAIWMEDKQKWSTDERDAIRLIDRELDKYKKENEHKFTDDTVKVMHMWDSDTCMIDKWHKYCQKQMRDNFRMLDEKLIFSNTKVTKESYASKQLPYPLEDGDISAYEKLITTLYDSEEREKIEWAIGCIVSGDSQKVQKFMVLYGAAGTGKSTILNIIQELFEGYYSVFDAKALGSSNSSFALEPFRKNPIVAIQHDGDLSRIEDNTRLNSLVSHEAMTVNEKFKSSYENQFRAFLIMGTNKPVRITDAKSGLIRRLIDVAPSGNKLPPKEYKKLMGEIKFELGAIAKHCLDFYLENPDRYDNYIPINMMGASNDFYNYMIDSYSTFKHEDGTTLKSAWEMYKTYCEEANVSYPMSQRAFKEELKNYFKEFHERFDCGDGIRVRSYYSGFRSDKFGREFTPQTVEDQKTESTWIELKEQESIFDSLCGECSAQYASNDETPKKPWANVKTLLKDLDTSKVHYVMPPLNHIVIDFDIKDENGNKSLQKNIEAASKWPKTYTEVSKGGNGLHLHYIYLGDVTRLARIYDTDIEIKVFNGKSSLRRKLSLCNNLDVSSISSGLPTKGEKMVDFDKIKDEQHLRNLIRKNLNKEILPNTKPSIDLIYKDLKAAYDSGMEYDVMDMYDEVFHFACNSSHQADACIKIVKEMPFRSKDEESDVKHTNVFDDYMAQYGTNEDEDLWIYDVECVPNLFFISMKKRGTKEHIHYFNPSPTDIAPMFQKNLIAYNCRRYDNHMIYACLIGYNNQQLFELSQKLTDNDLERDKKPYFRQAYNVSYTDVYDYCAIKQSLKKWEIDLGIHHQELGWPWDKPIPKEKWEQVATYCDYDVDATEAVFDATQADFLARQILADLAGGIVNDTTNSLTAKIIFGNDKNPQKEFNYRNLAEPVYSLDDETLEFLKEACPEMMAERHGEAKSLLPYFPGYTFDKFRRLSMYRGEEVGEGGYVDSKPGIHVWDALLDVASEHPHSAIADVIFGVKYTKAFRDIVEARVSIKHESWSDLDFLLGGKLKPYIQWVLDGKITSKDLAYAIKIAINAVYGQTAAKYPNRFKDERNIDNIVAKRGALFMIDLKHAVQERGFTVAHIKTDSIKIPNATPDIIKFVMDFGKRYGYTFEHEATYEKMCLVNDAVYIAKYATAEDCKKIYGYAPKENEEHGGEWTATGTQFRVPYVFKYLFSKEPIEFKDLCETKQVKTTIYLDMNDALPDVSGLEKELVKAEQKYRKGEMSDTTIESIRKELEPQIEKGHHYHFVGKVGLFCPMKPGAGGGLLVRESVDTYGRPKYDSVTGTKGFYWMESEMVKELHREDMIDHGYYHDLVNDAVAQIEKYGDFEQFVSDDPIPLPRPNIAGFLNIPEDAPDELPFD